MSEKEEETFSGIELLLVASKIGLAIIVICVASGIGCRAFNAITEAGAAEESNQ